MRELGALADLNKSVTLLWLVTGTVLDRQGITFNDPNVPTAKAVPFSKVRPTPPPAAAKKAAPAKRQR